MSFNTLTIKHELFFRRLLIFSNFASIFELKITLFHVEHKRI